MDITNIKPLETREVAIKHPATLEPVGLYVHIRPASHPEVKEAKRKQMDARLNKRTNKITAAQLEAAAMDLLVATIDRIEFRDGNTWTNGEVLNSTPADIRRMLKVDWVKEQIDSEAGDDAAFFGSSPEG